MAISEKICWAVLERAKGRSLTFGWTSPGEKPKGPPVDNAIGIAELERELVLRHSKQDIEDSLYFLEKRDYLVIHGLGLVLPRFVYSLSPRAHEALARGSFSAEEESAFAEALFDLKKPGWLGMKLNLGELMRRFSKWRSKRE